MPAGAVASSRVSRDVSYYGGRLTWPLVVATFVTVNGGALFGYDLGVSGGVTKQPDFLAKFFPAVHEQDQAPTYAYCTYDNWGIQLFTSCLFLAAAFAGLAANFTTRAIGRLRTMGLGGFFFLLGALLTGSALDLPMLIIGRLCLGVGVGLNAQAVPTYLAEVSPPNMRGALSIMFQMAITIGIFAAQLINYGYSTVEQTEWCWRVPLYLAGVPAVVLLLGSFILPESPNSLLERGQGEAALRNLRRFRGKEDVEEEFRDMQQAARIEAATPNKWLSIFRRRFRPELATCALIPTFQQWTGINSVMFYAPQIFAVLGLGSKAAILNTCIVGAINVLATLIAVAFVDRGGRRKLFLWGGAIMAASMAIMCAVLKTKLNPAGAGSIDQGWGIIILVVVCLFTAAFAFSWGPLGWLVPSEIQSLQTRSGGMAVAVFMNFLMTFVVGQAFLSMMCRMQSFVYLFFAATVTAFSAYIYFFFPETKRVPVEEMPLLWAQHWFWRRYAAAENSPLPVAMNMELAGAAPQPAPVAPLGVAGSRVHPSDGEEHELAAAKGGRK